MNGREYQKLAMKANDGMSNYKLINRLIPTSIGVGGMMNAALGLSGEVGEFNDMLKNH